MNDISDNIIAEKLTAFDWMIDRLVNYGCISFIEGICAKSVVRMPALIKLWAALDSGEAIPESLVDAAVECVGKFNESQIDSLPMPEFVKAEKKRQERQRDELVKWILKSILKSRGRLV